MKKDEKKNENFCQKQIEDFILLALRIQSDEETKSNSLKTIDNPKHYIHNNKKNIFFAA